MTRYAIFAKDDKGIWVNIYKDSRTYKSKRYAERVMHRFLYFRHGVQAQVREVEVTTAEEKVKRLETDLGSIVNFLITLDSQVCEDLVRKFLIKYPEFNKWKNQ